MMSEGTQRKQYSAGPAKNNENHLCQEKIVITQQI